MGSVNMNARGAGLIALIIVFTTLMTVAIAGRIWSLHILRRRYTVADIFVFVAWAATIAFNGTVIWDCVNGFGLPFEELSPSERVVFFKVLFATGYTWTTATVCCKLSVLFFCLHIFGHITSFRIACQTLIVLCIAYFCAFIPVFSTQCVPPSAEWTGKGTCRDLTQEELASVIANLILDTAVVVIPLPYIWSLHIPAFKKMGLSVTFGLGFAIVAILCWRLDLTLRLQAGQVETGYGTYYVGIQSTLEVSLGILAACLPTLAPVSVSVILPATKGLLYSVKDKFSSLNLSTSQGTSNASRKDTARNGSHQSLWPEHGDIPFSGFNRTKQVSEITHDTSGTPAFEQKGLDSDQIHVMREVEIDEESAVGTKR